MTNHTAPHSAHAHTNADPACWGWFQPRCSCGWTGELVADEGAANAEASAHMRSTEERSVETARERALEIIQRYAPSRAAESVLERAQRDDGSARIGVVLVLLLAFALPLLAGHVSTGEGVPQPSLPASVPPVLVLCWIGCAALAGMIANSKRRSVGGAVIGGLVFGLLAVLAVALMPSKRTPA